MVLVRVLDFGFVIDDCDIAERPKVLFAIADLIEAGEVMDEWPLGLRVILAKACRPHLASARCKPVSSPIENEKAERICVRLWGGPDRVPNWVDELSLVTSPDEPLNSYLQLCSS
ncbi:hypothetical protein [Ferrimicrobium sp.]|uniref:hypothetical protein n=1 Tax=Ferrimicrobium sp. TaxID=2926050 RepID=UPI002637BA3A|nr:hypothetical protein [Ferrimicrobium sp.]